MRPIILEVSSDGPLPAAKTAGGSPAACAAIPAWSTVLSGKEPEFGNSGLPKRRTASQIASASAASFLLRLPHKSPLDVGLHILRWHQPYQVAKLREFTRPIMGRRASFHCQPGKPAAP